MVSYCTSPTWRYSVFLSNTLAIAEYLKLRSVLAEQKLYWLIGYNYTQRRTNLNVLFNRALVALSFKSDCLPCNGLLCLVLGPFFYLIFTVLKLCCSAVNIAFYLVCILLPIHFMLANGILIVMLLPLL